MSGYLQRIALSALKPGESIQPVLGSVFSPPQFASGPKASSIETEQPVTPGAPSEFMPRADPRPSLDDPSVRAFQVPEPGPKDQQPADLIKNPIPTSIRSLLPGPKEKAEALIAPLHPAKSGHQQEREPLNARRETAAVVPPKQVVDGQGGETVPREAVASQNFRKVVPSTASPFTFGPDGKERIGSRRAEPARPEPDEIQIHIGRIEVTAVQPAAPRPAVARPRRSALSLDEYLRRRDRRVS